jgi:hypothetical protein
MRSDQLVARACVEFLDLLKSVPMRRLRIMIAALLVICWWPATSLCLVESAGWIKISGCCDESSSTDQSPCCALASASYKHDDHAQSVCSPSVTLRAEFPSPPIAASALPVVKHLVSVSPPELCRTWQFCIRAAANPRAPSFAS